MKLDLRKYEAQAKVSMILAVIGGLCALVGIGVIIRNFSAENFWVICGRHGWAQPAILGALFGALVASTIGFFLGFNSAGQRRNQQARLSWLGFFVNAGIIAMALAAGVFFALTRFESVK